MVLKLHKQCLDDTGKRVFCKCSAMKAKEGRRALSKQKDKSGNKEGERNDCAGSAVMRSADKHCVYVGSRDLALLLLLFGPSYFSGGSLVW